MPSKGTNAVCTLFFAINITKLYPQTPDGYASGAKIPAERRFRTSCGWLQSRSILEITREKNHSDTCLHRLGHPFGLRPSEKF
jgi:hypothetical protein